MADSVQSETGGSGTAIRVPLGVYFDTSELIGINRQFDDSHLAALLAIRSRLQFSLVVPQLVIDEYVAHHLRQDAEKIRKLNDTARFLHDEHGLSVPPVKMEADSLRRSIDARLRSRLAELDVVIAPLPTISLSALIAQSVDWVSPFAAEDRGFRDALIQEAIIADSQDRWHDPFIIVVTAEKEWSNSKSRFATRGVDVEFVTLRDAPKRIESFLDIAGRTLLQTEMKRALQFAMQHRGSIFKAVMESEYDMWNLRFVRGGEDPFANRTIHAIRSATPKEIASAYANFPSSGREVPTDRVPFDVFVDVDFEVETSYWRGGGSLFGPRFRIDKPVDVAVLNKQQEPMYEEWEVIRVTRSVPVSGSIDRAAFKSGRFEDLRLESNS